MYKDSLIEFLPFGQDDKKPLTDLLSNRIGC